MKGPASLVPVVALLSLAIVAAPTAAHDDPVDVDQPNPSIGPCKWGLTLGTSSDPPAAGAIVGFSEAECPLVDGYCGGYVEVADPIYVWTSSACLS